MNLYSTVECVRGALHYLTDAGGVIKYGKAGQVTKSRLQYVYLHHIVCTECKCMISGKRELLALGSSERLHD